MATLHPDKISAMNKVLGRRRKRPEPPAANQSALIHNLAAQMYAARRSNTKRGY